MTKPSHGPSLLQAREDTRSHPHPHSLFHRRRHADGPRGTTQPHHEHHHYSHNTAVLDGTPCAEPDADETARAPSKELARDIVGDVVQRDGAGVDTVVNVIKDPDSPYLTRIVQTVSLVQVVDPWGSAWQTRTVTGPPNTVVVDTSGNTIAVSAADVQATLVALAPSTAATTTPASNTGTTAPSTLTPSQASSLTSTPSLSASIYHTISDVRNGTNTALHGNSSVTLLHFHEHGLYVDVVGDDFQLHAFYVIFEDLFINHLTHHVILHTPGWRICGN
ncbi:FAD dependent oxidoreductase [Purpureocillium lavendulum]|uniref:FAD dependent oxidoreductase n=1 Tax=Purpureocillium lavendulum TaxID=1247861 RepID=A0AB34FI34_9HYPO|nr:FAD dependent oxidoreductase [Purpureocillium lavendulum]